MGFYIRQGYYSGAQFQLDTKLSQFDFLKQARSCDSWGWRADLEYFVLT